MATRTLSVIMYQAKMERNVHRTCNQHGAMSEIGAQANNEVRDRKDVVSCQGN